MSAITKTAFRRGAFRVFRLLDTDESWPFSMAMDHLTRQLYICARCEIEQFSITYKLAYRPGVPGQAFAPTKRSRYEYILIPLVVPPEDRGELPNYLRDYVNILRSIKSKKGALLTETTLAKLVINYFKRPNAIFYMMDVSCKDNADPAAGSLGNVSYICCRMSSNNFVNSTMELPSLKHERYVIKGPADNSQ
jgi:hypothetical protein